MKAIFKFFTKDRKISSVMIILLISSFIFVFDQMLLFGDILGIFFLNSGGPGLPGMMVEIDFRLIFKRNEYN